MANVRSCGTCPSRERSFPAETTHSLFRARSQTLAHPRRRLPQLWLARWLIGPTSPLPPERAECGAKSTIGPRPPLPPLSRQGNCPPFMGESQLSHGGKYGVGHTEPGTACGSTTVIGRSEHCSRHQRVTQALAWMVSRQRTSFRCGTWPRSPPDLWPLLPPPSVPPTDGAGMAYLAGQRMGPSQWSAISRLVDHPHVPSQPSQVRRRR